MAGSCNLLLKYPPYVKHLAMPIAPIASSLQSGMQLLAKSRRNYSLPQHEREYNQCIMQKHRLHSQGNYTASNQVIVEIR